MCLAIGRFFFSFFLDKGDKCPPCGSQGWAAQLLARIPPPCSRGGSILGSSQPSTPCTRDPVPIGQEVVGDGKILLPDSRDNKCFGAFSVMASAVDSWMKEFNEASKLADDVSSMISERASLPPSGPETQRHTSTIRRKITILGTRLDTLESLLANLPTKHVITEKELQKRENMLSTLRSKTKQMASTFNMSNFADRDDLLGPSKKSVDEIQRIAGLDNFGILGLQKQIIKEQDEGLEKLEETVYSTKHIALAVNEELDLHTRLIDTLDQQVEVTDSRLQRVQKRLAILNKRTKGGCSCMRLLSAVIAIVILVVIAWALINYL